MVMIRRSDDGHGIRGTRNATNLVDRLHCEEEGRSFLPPQRRRQLLDIDELENTLAPTYMNISTKRRQPHFLQPLTPNTYHLS